MVCRYSDARCVEYAALCVIRAIESFSRASDGSGLVCRVVSCGGSRAHCVFPQLDQILTTDTIRAIAPLLGSGSPIPQQTQTLLLRALATAARVSTKVTLALLERDVGVVEILWGILSGEWLYPLSLCALIESGLLMSFLASRHPTAHRRRSTNHLWRHGRDAECRAKAKRDGRGGTRAGLRDDARATER